MAVVVVMVVVVAVVVAMAVGSWVVAMPLVVHLYICWVLDKYIILMSSKYYFNI